MYTEEENINELTGLIIELCIKIHRTLGPGLLESVYEEALCHELAKENIPFVRQAPINVVYDGIKLNLAFRADIIVNNKLIIELKSTEEIVPVHKKIVLTYLRLSNLKIALLINFYVNLLKEGIHRIVNNL
ncbi:MAG TPA: GxxExxY protein [Bacteroidia bacterium]|nr:GxxExxY protein [Bacteroidia bacterium]HNU32070.1 GxxExxY protein [Bacteroidia bacterium]